MITQRFRYFVIRAAVEPESLVSSVREAVHDLDPELPLSAVATLDELLADSLTVPRNLSAIVAALAAVALLLSVIGIYGVMSYFVQQRTRDMGIRLALGGEPLGVVRLVVSQGMRIVAGGIGVGDNSVFTVDESFQGNNETMSVYATTLGGPLDTKTSDWAYFDQPQR